MPRRRARRGQGRLQLPHAFAAGAEWHSRRLEHAREVSRAEPQLQADRAARDASFRHTELAAGRPSSVRIVTALSHASRA
jgi:hypothetical protein